MKLVKTLCLDFSGSEIEPNSWQEVDALTESRVLVTREGIAQHQDADGLLVKLGAKVGKDIIDQLPSLQYIGMLGTGYGGIDTDYAASKGVTVTNIADYATEAVAEFTFGVLLEHLREVAKARSQAKAGNYSDDFTGGEIKGKKFGVIGLGNIGHRTADLAQAFGADVRYWSRNRKKSVENNGIEFCELDELLKTADIITLNLALNAETEGIINADRLDNLQPRVIFINPSPMELINFDALVEQLKRNSITFILDHSDEMTAAQLKTLQPMSNAIVYPPIAYITPEAGRLKKRIYVDNIKNFLAGAPSNKVN